MKNSVVVKASLWYIFPVMESGGCNSPWGILSSNEAGIAFSLYVYKGVLGVPTGLCSVLCKLKKIQSWCKYVYLRVSGSLPYPLVLYLCELGQTNSSLEATVSSSVKGLTVPASERL